mgnify:CR=1 FL=1
MVRTSEAMGGLVRVILVYKSGLAFFLTAKTKKLAIYSTVQCSTACSKFMQISNFGSR